MILRSWRIVKAKHAAAAFTGDGARLAGGRWNSQGVPVIYTAETRSLGILEMVVHIQSEEVLKHYVCFEVSFDDSLVSEVPHLPRTWWKSPAPAACRQLGDQWVAGQVRAVLRVPSAVVRNEWNYLLNPVHPDYPRISVGSRQSLRLDRRLT